MGDVGSGGRLAILTSGGDAPGMNAAIRAATMVAIGEGWSVLGVEHGYRGLLDAEFRSLAPADVAGIVREGGTILGTARCPEFHDAAARAQARAHLREHGVDRLLVVGGNGSLGGALALSDPAALAAEAEAGVRGPALKVVGLPASIDNDLGYTALSIGVDTAINTIVEACDKISDTASAHDRAFIVEVMGRDAGYLAMTAGIATGADAVLFPENGWTAEAVVEHVTETIERARDRARRGRVLIIKAEGVPVSVDALKTQVDARLRAKVGGHPVETRVTVLGHVVRGGRPSALDRLVASRLAHAGVRALAAGETRKMVGWRVPSAVVQAGIATHSPMDPHCALIDLEAALDETRRMLTGESPAVAWRIRLFESVEEVLRL